MPENFNDGWVAEVDGEELTPVRVDGWQQGWVLPAGEQVTVELRYRPEATYDVILPFGLVVSGAFLLGALAIALIALVARLRGRRPEPAPDVVWPAVEPTDRVVWAVAIGAALVLLGPVAAIGVLAGAVGRRLFDRSGQHRWRADRAVGAARRARETGGVRDARRHHRRARRRAAGRPGARAAAAPYAGATCGRGHGMKCWRGAQGAAAIGVIVVMLVVRGRLLAGSYFNQDDFYLTGRAY